MITAYRPSISKTLYYGNLISDWSVNRGLVSRWLTLPLLKGRPLFTDIVSTRDGSFSGYSDSPWRGSKGRQGGFGSIVLDGADDTAIINSISLASSANFSVIAWIFPTNLGNKNPIIGTDDTGTGIAINSSVCSGKFDGSDFEAFSISPTVDTWQGFTFVRNGTTVSVYLNGIFAGSSTNAANTSSGTFNRLFFGATSGEGGRYFTGYADDVGYFNRALSSSDVWLLFEDSRRGYPNSLNWLSNTAYFLPTVAAGIAFDVASNSGYQAAASTYSWSHTCTGANRFLAVDVSLLSAGSTVSGITYNGVALSPITNASISTLTSFGRVECWGLVNPASGSNTIEVTLSESIVSSGTAVSYTGVHQTSPTEAGNAAQATNVGAADATVTITSVADNDWIHAAIATDDGSVTAGKTSRNNVTGAGGSGADEDTGPITPAGGTAMTYTNVGALATWAIAGYAIRPLAAPNLGSVVPCGAFALNTNVFMGF